MAVALGTETTSKGVGSGGPYTSVGSVSHNNAGANVLLALIYGSVDGSFSVTSPQYNSVALTEIGVSSNTQDPGGCVWAGYLISPDSGANNFTATLVSSTGLIDSYVVVLIPVTGANTSDLIGVLQTESHINSGTSTSHTNTTESNNSMHLLAISMRDGVNPGDITGGDGATEKIDDQSGASAISDCTVWLGFEIIATAGSDTLSASWATSERRSAISFEIKEEVAGGTGLMLAGNSLAISGGNLLTG